MVPAIDVKHINPFLQSSISIVESVTQVKLTVGKPEMTDFHLHDKYYAIQVGVVGEMKGQVILAIRENNAKDIASRMMYKRQDIDGIKVPLMYGGEEYIGLYICVYEDK